MAKRKSKVTARSAAVKKVAKVRSAARPFKSTARGAAIKKVAKVGIDNKIVTTFDTHFGHESKAIMGMEKLLRKIAPRAKLISPGYSGRVDGFRGPLNDAVVPEARAFGETFGHAII